MSNKGLFNLIFGRDPKINPEIEGEDPRIESLRKALETSTPERGGAPWLYRKEIKEEPELI